MKAYTSFAEVYDIFMDDIPYGAWSRYIHEVLCSYRIFDGLVCELGCGTGKMTRLLAQKGYDMIGIDSSEEMLCIAREQPSDGILYLEQDMREFELYGTVRAIISVCDTMNYLLDADELLQVFRLANNYLDPGGIFLFDLNTIYQFSEQMSDRVFVEHREEGSLIWENYYDKARRLNQYDLTFFLKTEGQFYQKQEETHFERGYEVEEVVCLLEKAGLEVLNVCDASDYGPVREDSSKVYFLAREHQKKL